MYNMYMLSDNEIIFNEKDNQITNIGFSLNSVLNKFQHIIGGGEDDDEDSTSSMSEHLKHVAIPTTLYLTSRQVLGGKHRQEINNDEVLSDELHDKLLELIEDKPVKKTSRKNRKTDDMPTKTTTTSDTKSKKKTRKNR
jgi:hypothetical protein